MLVCSPLCPVASRTSYNAYKNLTAGGSLSQLLARYAQQLLPPYDSRGSVAHKHSRHATLDRGVEHITSVSNEYVKHCVKLRTNARYREEQQACILVGMDLIKEAAVAHSLRALVLMLQAGQEVPPCVVADKVLTLGEGPMKKVTGLETADGVEAVVEVSLPSPADFYAMQPKTLKRLLVLDGVRDPGNMGNLLRSALAFGWQGVYLLPECCDPFNDKVMRSSRGGSFRLPIFSGSIEGLQELAAYHGLKLLAADMHDGMEGSGEPVNWAKMASAPVGLVLGAEGPGLSSNVRRLCSAVSIPMREGAMESLNVSVAGGILLFMLSGGAPQLTQRLASLLTEDSVQ